MKLLDFFKAEERCSIREKCYVESIIPCPLSVEYPEEYALALKKKLVKKTRPEHSRDMCVMVTPKGSSIYKQLLGDFT